MRDKKIYVVEQTTKPLPNTYKHFVRADDIGKAHRFGRVLFGHGISFKTREPNLLEQQIIKAHKVWEVE